VIRLKERILGKLKDAIEDDRVDEDVVPLLDAVNRFRDAVTTSSCSGRVQLIQVGEPGDKVGAKVLGKWHRRVDQRELREAVDGWNGEGQLHLLVQPLLLHVRCRDLQTAVVLRHAAQESGLKFSTIRSVRMDRAGEIPEWGVVVEFLGTERMEVPLHVFGEGQRRDALFPLLEHGNELLKRTKLHIDDLVSALSLIDLPLEK